ncbi:MAG: MBL fold metallo-hydrolase [Maricaulis sp.]|uniref:MBL fold metallo-hydrolase n=1 Tax=Maricaulis sp. TaxID=1486257 RepID=UPI001B189ABE|nr:MBL fold metallo-hydrolase [Maricaulis sp.]MBO6730108.1 MBL fold metallo-hydrolase [Maricaulis sp.]MBO6847376.1 MBL fold metallo-hydrolase [Maricaulis sp.]MBO6876424.1 MBL fold metallo-hydrolase [Maricaulis sp.]
MSAKPEIKAFFDPDTYTISYVVWDAATNAAAIIDSVLNYDPASGRTQPRSADELIRFVEDNSLTVEWILETHVHADHLSAAPYLHDRLGGTIGIGEHVKHVQGVFGDLFNAEDGFQRDGSQFGKLFTDGETFKIGSLEAEAIWTPGHTPACMVYHIGDAAFVGDTLFMPDFGTARCDFPGGDAHTLWQSIQKIFALPDKTRLFMCHDYKAPGRDFYAWETTVGEEKAKNIHVKEGTDEQAFIKMRTERDAKLSMPTLILPSVQVNMRAGHMPEAEDNGTRYLKIPLNAV